MNASLPCVTGHAWRPQLNCEPSVGGSGSNGGNGMNWLSPCNRPWLVLLATGVAYLLGKESKKRKGAR